jgi:hypothetical protein
MPFDHISNASFEAHQESDSTVLYQIDGWKESASFYELVARMRLTTANYFRIADQPDVEYHKGVYRLRFRIHNMNQIPEPEYEEQFTLLSFTR